MIIVHYDEIALKGQNRNFFEKKLVKNIEESIEIKPERVSGRFFIDSDDEKLTEKLKKIPGISYFFFSEKCETKIDDIKKKSLKVLKNKDFSTFKVISRRVFKGFEKTSQEVNEIVGEYVINELDKKAKMVNPDIELYIDIFKDDSFVYTEKHDGIGGLPVSSSGKILSSLSGGIDSPVASYMMMKRGCKVIFVHIHNETVEKGIISKIKEIAEILSEFQNGSKLYIVPFGEIQKKIIMAIPSKYRMIIYRRFMMKIMNEIARKEKAKAIVTGDSVGQVASQTLENINSIYEASRIPVFSPLIGMNKREITDLSREIGTYDASIRPYPDCCSYMIAKHPEIKSRLEEIKEIENLIEDIENLVKDSIKNSEVFKS